MAKAPTDTLFIGNLTSEVTEGLLHEICCQAGEIIRINLKAAGTGQYAFCQYTSIESAIYAWALLRDCVRLHGRTMNVDFSKSGDSELDDRLQELWQKAQTVVNYSNEKVVQMATQSRSRYLQSSQHDSSSGYGRPAPMVRHHSAASNGGWDSSYGMPRASSTEAYHQQSYNAPPAYAAHGGHYGAPAGGYGTPAAAYAAQYPPHLQQQQQPPQQQHWPGHGYPAQQQQQQQLYQGQQYAPGYSSYGSYGGYPPA